MSWDDDDFEPQLPGGSSTTESLFPSKSATADSWEDLNEEEVTKITLTPKKETQTTTADAPATPTDAAATAPTAPKPKKKKKPAAKRSRDPNDSESEEDDEEEEEIPVKKTAPAKKAAPAPVKAKAAKAAKAKSPAAAAVNQPVLDPVEDKKQLEKLQKHSELRMVSELFGVEFAVQRNLPSESDMMEETAATKKLAAQVKAPEVLDKFQPKTTKDFDEFAALLLKKTREWTKNPQYSYALKTIALTVTQDLDYEELRDVAKDLNGRANTKQQAEKKKPAAKSSTKKALNIREDKNDDLFGFI